MKKLICVLFGFIITITLISCGESEVVQTSTTTPSTYTTAEYTLPLESSEVLQAEEVVKELTYLDYGYTEYDLEILAIIIYQEHGGDASSDTTRIMIGNVFLNRVNSPLFPDTFEEVATQSKQWGTLSTTGIKWADRASNPSEADAVARAYDCAERVLEGETLLQSNVIWAAEFEQGTGTYCKSDGTYFCY